MTATNVDLNEAVSAGHFRLDLFYRLNIVQVQLPPLRDRIGDIAPLANHFLGLYSRRLGLPEPRLGADALAALQAYSWPGNIRELENVIHFALLVASEQEIRPEHLKLVGQPARQVRAAPLPLESALVPPPLASTPLQDLRRTLCTLLEAPPGGLLGEVEGMIVDEAFRISRGNQVRAAALLGISRNVMRTLLKRYGHLRDGGQEELADQVSEG